MTTTEDVFRDRLIVALDFSDPAEARALVDLLGSDVAFYKIGFQLVLSGGIDLARRLVSQGKKVFLDMKLLDIDNTVVHAVEAAVAMGVDMLTVHAYPKAMAAAVGAASGSSLCLLGVTVLTSMDDADLHEAGYAATTAELVRRRAAQAREIGMGGIVCSPAEASLVREIVGPSMAIVTPGVRPPGSQKGDQKRVMTPAEAMRAGASHIVVGRPITAVSDPRAATRAILDEIASVA